VKDSVALLDNLIGFPTVSSDSNLEMIVFIGTILEQHGIAYRIIGDESGKKANLYATVGPTDRPGVMLSGHTDVVPVEGQTWTVDPFTMSESDGRLYGRGTTDMKGFLACMLRAATKATTMNLKTPLHLAFSYDEEIGCVGVRSLIDMLDKAPQKPAFCIIGEPTSLQVATAHKGKTALRATCHGRECHSALAPEGLNAIHLATDLISEIRSLQSEIEKNGAHDGDYDVPFTTLHVGIINGGSALNIVPGHCTLEFEFRNLAADEPQALIDEIRQRAGRIVAEARKIAVEADIIIESPFAYPGLDTPPDSEVVSFVKSLTGANSTTKIAFGTEGGLFQQKLDIPTVVCGPGSMSQGHKPDEFIARQQIEACDTMLDELLKRLAAGQP